jgi:hypothetical protein
MGFKGSEVQILSPRPKNSSGYVAAATSLFKFVTLSEDFTPPHTCQYSIPTNTSQTVWKSTDNDESPKGKKLHLSWKEWRHGKIEA